MGRGSPGQQIARVGLRPPPHLGQPGLREPGLPAGIAMCQSRSASSALRDAARPARCPSWVFVSANRSRSHSLAVGIHGVSGDRRQTATGSTITSPAHRSGCAAAKYCATIPVSPQATTTARSESAASEHVGEVVGQRLDGRPGSGRREAVGQPGPPAIREDQPPALGQPVRGSSRRSRSPTGGRGSRARRPGSAGPTGPVPTVSYAERHVAVPRIPNLPRHWRDYPIRRARGT